MTAEELIDALEAAKKLPEPMLKRLRQKLAANANPPSGRSLAKFLVNEGHLSKDEAKSILRGPETEQVDLAAFDPLGGGLDTLGDAGLGPEPADAAIDEKSSKGKKKSSASKGKRKKAKKNEFDSPLILIGGGSLALLLLVGGAILYYLNSESGDALLSKATESFEAGAYTQAIDFYNQFTTKFPNHPSAGQARVQSVLANLRQKTGSNDKIALQVAADELPRIEDEPYFNEQDQAKAELSTLLPKIARGLAEKADTAGTQEEIESFVELSKQAIGLSNNTKYVPRSLRDEGDLEETRAILDRIARRQTALDALSKTIKSMQDATSNGDIRGAYGMHAEFIKAHPELMEEGALAEAIAAASASEQGLVRYEAKPKESAKEEGATPLEAVLALADRRVQGVAPASGPVVVEFSGVLYGLDSKDGRLLWRRYLGRPEASVGLVRTADAVLAWDAIANELLSLEPATGALQWRLPVGEPILRPAVQANLALVTLPSGRVLVVNLASGDQVGEVQFPQAVSAPAAFDGRGERIYVAGEQSSVYSLDAKSFECLGVYYSGHSPGSIVAAPTPILDKVMLLQNIGAATSRVRVLSSDDQGAIGEELDSYRMNGLVIEPPHVFNRRFAVVCNSGEITVFETAAGSSADPLTVLAVREPASNERSSGASAVVEGNLWVADRGITKYAIAPSGKRLPARTIDAPLIRDRFVGEILSLGDVLVHSRRRSGTTGVTVAAADAESARLYWETDLATAPAGPPVAVDQPRGILQAAADGRVFFFDRDAVGRRILDTSLPAAAERPAQPLEFLTAISADSFAVSAGGSVSINTIDLTNQKAPVVSGSLPSPLACEPTPVSGGWIAPLKVGQVFLLGKQGAQPLGTPFQPTIQPGEAYAWLPAAAGDGVVVVTDGVQNIHCLAIDSGSLKAVQRSDVGPSPIVGRGAMLDRVVAFPTQGGRLMLLSTPSLESVADPDLGSPAVWGPYAVGPGRCVVVSADGEMAAVDADGSIAWQLPLSGGDLTGAPAVEGDSLLATTKDGRLIKVNLNSGELASQVFVGQPIASGPTMMGPRVLIAAADGAVLVISPPK
ncbi:outer membrane biogenesis protein BamB [Pirellulimonas nuda]|uniref:Outer membrane biogenesis protein BamB n=1 Tax=Pirellulimonas nuda TaxID=2528009 RepID=A0A518DB96_9BACT|nr:PQQ-binding-like beta-propeller repeat protein [Pirellulimonas nuda]QDU88722.1 outer membrane biogenesis protein BamB [Pirellulimonas nuda]